MSVCTCTPKQKESGRLAVGCRAHHGFTEKPPRKTIACGKVKSSKKKPQPVSPPKIEVLCGHCGWVPVPPPK
jgi:hypothetical protein